MPILLAIAIVAFIIAIITNDSRFGWAGLALFAAYFLGGKLL